MNKSVLITGASSGIGRALSLELAGRGCSLALTARDMERLAQVQYEIHTLQPQTAVATARLDVTDYDSVPRVIQHLAKELNGLDIVVVNAGIALLGKIGIDPFAQAKQNIETNLIGAMATIDAALGLFIEQGMGHIVGISSFGAFRGMPNLSAYCASKAGLATYLEALRAEVYNKNIDVTVLYPGFIDTPLNQMEPHRPFLISAEKGAQIIARMIEKKAKSSTVPVLPWKILSWLIRIQSSSSLASK